MPRDVLIFTPEIAVLVGALVVFVLPLAGVSRKAVQGIGIVFALLAVVAAALGLGYEGEPFYPGIYVIDAFSQIFKLGLAGGLLLVLLLTGEMRCVRADARADVPVFFFFSTAGMMMLVSATEMLTLYVSLEMAAYGLYVLVALGNVRDITTEASLKYVVFGVVASAVTLYGFSLLFGLTGSTYIADIVAYAADKGPTPVLVVAILLTFAGIFFKLALFPFHGWAPDVYQGAPHIVVTFVGTVSKLAAVGVTLRVASLVWKDAGELTNVLFVLSILSMTYGNLAAIVQKDIKRLLAYSTIAHAGYVVIGLMTFSQLGTTAAIFYVIVYVFMAFCAFLVVGVLGRDGENPTVASLSGLWHRSPFLALVLIVGIFGLAGIPPTPGFAGKWLLFSAAIEHGAFWLVFFAAVNVTVALYYYLQLIRAAFVFSPEGQEPVVLDRNTRLAGTLGILLVVYFGIFPNHIFDLAEKAARALGG